MSYRYSCNKYIQIPPIKHASSTYIQATTPPQKKKKKTNAQNTKAKKQDKISENPTHQTLCHPYSEQPINETNLVSGSIISGLFFFQKKRRIFGLFIIDLRMIVRPRSLFWLMSCVHRAPAAFLAFPLVLGLPGRGG